MPATEQASSGRGDDRNGEAWGRGGVRGQRGPAKPRQDSRQFTSSFLSAVSWKQGPCPLPPLLAASANGRANCVVAHRHYPPTIPSYPYPGLSHLSSLAYAAVVMLVLQLTSISGVWTFSPVMTSILGGAAAVLLNAIKRGAATATGRGRSAARAAARRGVARRDISSQVKYTGEEKEKSTMERNKYSDSLPCSDSGGDSPATDFIHSGILVFWYSVLDSRTLSIRWLRPRDSAGAIAHQ